MSLLTNKSNEVPISFEYQVVSLPMGGFRLIIRQRLASRPGDYFTAGIFSSRAEAEAAGRKIVAIKDTSPTDALAVNCPNPSGRSMRRRTGRIISPSRAEFSNRMLSFMDTEDTVTYFAKLFPPVNGRYQLAIGQPDGSSFRGPKAGVYDSPSEALEAARNILQSINPIRHAREMQRLVHVTLDQSLMKPETVLNRC